MAETLSKSADGKRLVVNSEIGSFTPETIEAQILQLTERKTGIEAEIAKWEARKAAAKAKGVAGAK